MIKTIRQIHIGTTAALLLLTSVTATAIGAEKTISRAELKEGIEGYWNGQLAGNFLGFPFENLYQETPIPTLIDHYYTLNEADSAGLKINRNDRRCQIRIMADALGGAWSDDDSDVEFVYLHGVERHGLDISNEQLTDLWRDHINRFIWGSARIARDLMDQGKIAPETGSKSNNEEWYRISSQLMNEIWGVFYPGMLEDTKKYTSMGAHVTCDDWGTHPAVFYSVLCSAAFFEKDIQTLVEIGKQKLPEDSPFREGIDAVISWHRQYEDWRTTRQLLHEKYYHKVGDFEIPYPPGSSFANGLASVIALLYGEGDWLKTVSIATTLGYDCDNQASTCGAILGILNGASAIPESFTLQMPSRGRWTEPFNDTYINYSRDGLPNYNRISDIVNRILSVAEKAILKSGGEKRLVEGEIYYTFMTEIE